MIRIPRLTLGATLSSALLVYGCLPGPGFETLVQNRSTSARVVERMPADAYEGDRFFALSPGSDVVVDTTGGSNAPIDELVIYDASCVASETIDANFSDGATVTISDGPRAQRQLGRPIDTEHLRSPDSAYGDKTCEAAAAKL